MAIYESCEREIIIRKSNEDECWHVYVTQGATGAGKLLKNMKVLHEDENGTTGTLPLKAVSIRTVIDGETPKKKRTFTEEQRAAVAERFKKYHADKRAAGITEPGEPTDFRPDDMDDDEEEDE